MRPTTPPSRKPRTKSPKYTTRQPKQYFHDKMENEYPLHEKYDLQDVYATANNVIVKATRQPREGEEINIDLPAFVVYHRQNKHWLLTKGPTSKFYDDPWYNNIELLIGATGVQQTNTAYWSWKNLVGIPSYHDMTYSK